MAGLLRLPRTMKLVRGRKRAADRGREECMRFPASEELWEVSCSDDECEDVEPRSSGAEINEIKMAAGGSLPPVRIAS